MTKISSFLPAGYNVPKSSGGYMKFQKGENKFRILSSPIIGMECWTVPDKDGKSKPVRFKMEQGIEGYFKDSPKHFWAMIVWNYNSKAIEILEITQKGIQNSIKSLIDNPKWGSPFEYDINVTRQGEGMETEYNVTPDPKESLSKEIKDKYSKVKINLNALYEGKDPFENAKEIDIDDIDDSDTEKDDLKEINDIFAK